MEQEEGEKNEREEEDRTLLLNCAYPETSLLQLLSTWRQAPPPPHCARLSQKNVGGASVVTWKGEEDREREEEGAKSDWSPVFQR